MKILHLTLKKKGFDMIASGEKKEEYREIKDYWVNRLCNVGAEVEHCGLDYKDFDIVEFKNGYSKDAPKVHLQFIECYVDKGKPEWGAELDKEYFVIKLGEILKSDTLIK